MSALESVAPWARRSRLRGALVELAIALEPHRDALAAELDAGEDATRGLAVSPAFGAALRWASTPADALRSNAAFCREALASAEEPPTEAGAPSPRAIFETLHEQLATPIPFLVHAVLPAVREAFRREKERAGVLDFDDLLTALRDAIAGEPAIRRALRARYRHALVDEFQDTDEVQWEIFRRLFLDRDEGDVSHASPSTLIVIGDAKQAIYGFRSADVHTYEDACRALEAAGAQRIVLDASFRSSPAMLAAQDRILRADAQDSTLARGFAGYERRLVAGRAARSALDARGDAAPAVVVQHLLGLVPLRAGLVRRALADAIARECRALVEGGALRLVDAREGGEAQRSLRYSDVFVLTRTGREGLEVADALGRAHVPHAFFKQSGLFASREAREVLDVLRAIAAPEDRSARTRALIGPFLGVPFGELAAAHALDANHPLARRLARWAELAAEGRLAALFAALVEGSGPLASGLTRRALYLHEGERVLVNHRHVLDLLLARSSERRLSLGELVVELEARIARSASGEEDDEDVQKLESEREAVQILTMHKSKGLEAEVVFLFGGFGAAPRRALEPRVAHERPTDPRLPSTRIAYALDPTLLATSRVRAGDDGELVPLADALEREAQLELERLYYVAMTRAKRRLYLPYVGPPPAGAPRRDDVRYAWERPSGSYRVLDERLAALARSGALAPPFFALEPIEVGPPTPTRGRTTQLAPQPRATLASIRVEDPRERALRVHALSGIEETSYTRMSAWAKARRAPSLEAPKIELAPAQAALAGELADEAGAASGPSGARFGVLVHGVLEELLVERLVPRDAASVLEAPRVRRRMEEHGASDEERALASLLAYRALVTPLEAESLSLPSGVGALARRAVEMPFLFPVPERAHPPFARSMRDLAIERGLVRGVIDLFFEHEGRAWVLDWKTDRLPSYDAASLGEHVERAYELQLALYTLAALRALARASGPSELAAVHARLGGVLYVFVRGFGADPSAPGLGVFATRPSLADVTAWERALREQDALLGGPLPERRHPLGLLVDADEEAG